jgi:hypothetical protein
MLIEELTQMIETFDFSGNSVTIIGFIGIVSSLLIMTAIYHQFWNSPYNN